MDQELIGEARPGGINTWPRGERPRERLLERGAQALSDAELLAVVLGTGTGGANALDIARELLRNFDGSLRRLLTAEASVLLTQRGLGPARYSTLMAALELARRHYCEALRAGPALNAPAATRQFLTAQLRDRKYEVFCCLHLDNRHRLIHFEEVFRGTIDGASVHPREVVRQALQYNAAALIFAHNHPSGVAEPRRKPSAFSRPSVTLSASISPVSAVSRISIVTRAGSTCHVFKARSTNSAKSGCAMPPVLTLSATGRSTPPALSSALNRNALL